MKPSRIAEIRRAVADYMQSEGCSCCCDNIAHSINKKRLAKLLRVPPYADGSGFQFSKFNSLSHAKEKK